MWHHTQQLAFSDAHARGHKHVFPSGFFCPFFQRARTLTAVVIIKWKNPRQSRKSATTAKPAGPRTRARGAWAVTSWSIP